jgi:hypothetical protein
MPRLVGITAGIILIGSCVPAVPIGSARFQVNDVLREACWFLNDAEIAAGITTVEGDREAGLTKQGAIVTSINGCERGAGGNAAGATACFACFAAIIDQIYP